MIRTTPENIVALQPNEIFVFGSNLAGRHGKGAAKMALKFGAVSGIGFGRCGQTWAIPTKDAKLRQLPLCKIEAYVREFLFSVQLLDSALIGHKQNLVYLVTPIGCGLAGYTPADIAPMFKNAPANVILPVTFLEILQILP